MRLVSLRNKLYGLEYRTDLSGAYTRRCTRGNTHYYQRPHVAHLYYSFTQRRLRCSFRREGTRLDAESPKWSLGAGHGQDPASHHSCHGQAFVCMDA